MLPGGDAAQNALELAERYQAESTLVSDTRVRDVFRNTAILTHEEVDLTTVGRAAFHGTLMQCRKLDGIHSGIQDMRYAQGQIQSQLLLASAFQCANQAIVDNLDSRVGRVDADLARLETVAAMVVRCSPCTGASTCARQPHASFAIGQPCITCAAKWCFWVQAAMQQ